jgi:hypothetical protein
VIAGKYTYNEDKIEIDLSVVMKVIPDMHRGH